MADGIQRPNVNHKHQLYQSDGYIVGNSTRWTKSVNSLSVCGRRLQHSGFLRTTVNDVLSVSRQYSARHSPIRHAESHHSLCLPTVWFWLLSEPCLCLRPNCITQPGRSEL